MKRFLTGLFALGVSCSLYALPVGNPLDASLLCDGVVCAGDCCSDFCDAKAKWCESWTVRFGFYGDYIYDRHMKNNDYSMSGTIHNWRARTNAGYLALNFFNRLDIFSTLGATKFWMTAHRSIYGSTEVDDLTLETDSSFSWSLGARATLWECGCFGVGAEFQYFHSRPLVNYIRDENNSMSQYCDDTIIYRDYQLALGAAYRINIASCTSTALVPYAALKVGRAMVNYGDLLYDDFTLVDHTILNQESDRNWGYALGVTLVGCNKIGLTLEGRFLDEKALHINGQIRY